MFGGMLKGHFLVFSVLTRSVELVLLNLFFYILRMDLPNGRCAIGTKQIESNITLHWHIHGVLWAQIFLLNKMRKVVGSLEVWCAMVKPSGKIFRFPFRKYLKHAKVIPEFITSC